MCETQLAAQEEPVDLVAAIRRHFAGVEVELEMPDRAAVGQGDASHRGDVPQISTKLDRIASTLALRIPRLNRCANHRCRPCRRP
jgi:hypothetical protein